MRALKLAGVFGIGALSTVFGQLPSNNLRFTPITPCRVLDTRGNGFSGAFGPPALEAGGGAGEAHFTNGFIKLWTADHREGLRA